jgi:hypothetical protein
MSRNCFLLLVSVILSQVLSAQYFNLSGKITNNKLEPLALVSVKIKGFPNGTVTREDGTYELKLEEGEYDLVISMLGFKPQVINLVLRKDYVQNIILEAEEAKNLSEVVVRGKTRDRSEEIIRNVIRHKDEILAAAGAYSCTVYIKATQEDSSALRHKKNKKSLKDSLKLNNANADLQKMSMAEISLRYDHESDNRVKEERTGVAKRGNPESLFYLSQTEGDFNLYNNLIKTPALSVVPFLSPVSYSGFAAYKYKMISIKQQGNRKLYTISIKPRQLSNVTVEGEITIIDSAWVILSSRFTLPPFHIPEYDVFEINQQYSFVDNKAWMITRQQFTYFSKTNKGKVSGETIASYKDFEFNKIFPRKYFGTEVSATTQEAYERDSSFWQKTRTEPLTSKEIRFIQYRDSIHRVMTSKGYLDSIDRITNKITWKKLLLTGLTQYNREKERTWILPPVTGLYELFQFGGARLAASGSYLKTYKSRKNIFITADISYGFRNKDVNGGIQLNRMYNPFNRGFYHIELDRDFQYIYEGDAWVNMIKRNNFYLNNALSFGHGLEIANGLFFYTDLELALRRSLSNYKTNSKVDSLFGNVLDNNQAIAFDPYNAVYGKIRLQYTPYQRYIREPKEKIILGSKWPTFYVSWRKGIPGIMKSKVDFDYLEFGIEQELKLGITGVSKYKIISGSFLNTKDLRVIDYKFQRRGDPWLFMNPQEAFQSLDSTFPLFKRFYQGHYLHEFNGAILNKIPFLKKLQLREIAGAGFLIAPERELRYAEVFMGVERVFKWPFDPRFKLKMGVYLIGSAANQFRNPIQFKVGFMSWDKKRNKWI